MNLRDKDSGIDKSVGGRKLFLRYMRGNNFSSWNTFPYNLYKC
jgi:hypothetical protein